MKLPIEIASIIAAFGTRELTFSEKRKLVHWYQQLNRNVELEMFEEEEKKTEKKVLEMIMDYIDQHPDR